MLLVQLQVEPPNLGYIIMRWKLFLDDERYPPTSNWIIARNMADAVWYVTNYGVPYHISFDHDLGQDDTGMTFCRWFCNHILNGAKLPDDFSYYVHSMNPVGKENIEKYMKNFIDFNSPQ
jgi:hypothetical protein